MTSCVNFHRRGVSPATKWFAALLALGLTGCASVDPEPDYEQAREQVIGATGADSLFQPGDEEQTAERVEELLQDGLALNEAVQICLLNNRELRVLLFEIGVRRADAVQAGLLTNPQLNVLLRFPLDGGATTTEAGLVQNVIELWQLPPRKRLAESRLEQTVLEVAQAAANLAADAKSAYFRASASSAALVAAEENLATAREFLALTIERRDAGAATQVDVNTADSEAIEQEALVREARFALFDGKRRLALVLGLATRPRDLELSEALTNVHVEPLNPTWLLQLARESRLDMRAASKSLAAAESALVLEQRSLFKNLRAGFSFEDDDGEAALGPLVRMQIPIFDQNQAQVAKAEFRCSQAASQLAALDVRIAQEVRGAFEGNALAADMARLYEERLLPLRRSSLDLARESFTAGKTGFLSVLEAQSQLLAARREYVKRLEAVALSVPALEAACGRPLVELVETAPTE